MVSTKVIGAVVVVIIILAAGAYLLVKHSAFGNYQQNGATGTGKSQVNSTPTTYTTLTSTPTTTVAPKVMEPAIQVKYNSTVGNYLTNSTGWALYLYTPDNDSSNSVCYSTCAKYWPPLYASNVSNLTLQSGYGLNASQFTTTLRTDGTKQLVYKGWPLYYYAGDKAAGVVNGQGFDNIWYVLNVPEIIIPNQTTSNTISNSITSTANTTTTTGTTVASSSSSTTISTTVGGYGGYG